MKPLLFCAVLPLLALAQQGPVTDNVQTTTKPKSTQPAPTQTTAPKPAPKRTGTVFKPEKSDEPQETPTFRSEAHLVRMLATVRDAKGGIVGSLTADQFRVVVDGAEQEIRYFEPTTEQPLSVALLIDCSRSTQREHRTELDAVKSFARALFKDGNEGDAASLYSFTGDVTLDQPWTRSAERIERALGRLQSEGATALYDAVRLAAENIAARDGRHVLVVVSDGGDTFSRTTFPRALETVHGSDAIVYGVIIQPVQNEAGRNVGGENALIALAESTGGKSFYTSNKAELAEAFARILSDLRTQYFLTFYPRGVAASQDRTHKIEIGIRMPGYVVDARRIYFDPPAARGFKPASAH